jgi:hypothetical protein
MGHAILAGAVDAQVFIYATGIALCLTLFGAAVGSVGGTVIAALIRLLLGEQKRPRACRTNSL